MKPREVYDYFVCFGDSLTQRGCMPGGFVASLQDIYQRRLDVVSRGFSGYTSRQGLALCPTLFEPPSQFDTAARTRIATIWFGTNDCIRPGHNQHVPPDEFHENMVRIITEYFQGVHILLLTPTTMVPKKLEGHEDDTGAHTYGKILRDVAQEASEKRSLLGESEKVILIDLYTEFAQKAQSVPMEVLFTEDGLHISSLGNEVVFQKILATIREHLPRYDPDTLPFVYPTWRGFPLDTDMQSQRHHLQPRAIF